MAAEYTVTGIEDTTLALNGRFVDARKVSFRTTKGVTSFVEIPRELFTPENVAEAILVEVAAIDATQSL